MRPQNNKQLKPNGKMNSSTSLIQIAPEVIALISRQLSGADRKSLRLSCTHLARVVELPLERIFISSNRADIDVFRAIASHSVFRHKVKEIIWDEARFPMMEDNQRSPCLVGKCFCELSTSGETPPEAYTTAYQINRPKLRNRFQCKENTLCMAAKKTVAILETVDPPVPSYDLYSLLVREQQQVIRTNDDIQVFEYGLNRFPALVRVTMTPATHGWYSGPLYETSMIRSFPLAFKYPIPRGWPTPLEGHLGSPQWDHAMKQDCYRGFTAIIRALAEKKHTHIRELVINTNQQPTGISCHLFRAPNDEYDHFCQVLQHPGFRRLDLSLHANTAWESNWVSFRNGRLYDALANAGHLERFSFYTNVIANPDMSSAAYGYTSMKHFIPLQSIFPICKWPKLKHFGLAQFMVCQADVVELLAALPDTVESVEFSVLHFLEGGGNYASLLQLMRDQLKWDQRPLSKQPRVSVLDARSWETAAAESSDQQVNDFLYGQGLNPFEASSMTRAPSKACDGLLPSEDADAEVDVSDGD